VDGLTSSHISINYIPISFEVTYIPTEYSNVVDFWWIEIINKNLFALLLRSIAAITLFV
jgi:hypothetical protein